MSLTSHTQDLVIVGKKPTFRYVTACITLFNRGFQEISLKARGRSISNCVDTVELLRKGFRKDIRVKNISIWSEEHPFQDRKRYISYMQITIELTEREKTPKEVASPQTPE